MFNLTLRGHTALTAAATTALPVTTERLWVRPFQDKLGGLFLGGKVLHRLWELAWCPDSY